MSVRIPLHELRFRTSRSGGPGGQNVNKLETRVELLFDVRSSSVLTEEQKRLVAEKLARRIDDEGVLHVVAQQTRSQWENKRRAIERLHELLQKALRPQKRRMKTKPTAVSRERRLSEKKQRAEIKRLRSIRNDE